MYFVYRYLEQFKNQEGVGGWSLFAKRVTKRATVRQIHKLETMGYDRDVSIYVSKGPLL